jgi:flavin-dependent dehydrogenase
LSKLYDVVIVGAGPAGIFTALELVKSGRDLKVLIIDKGRAIEDRSCVARVQNAPCSNC